MDCYINDNLISINGNKCIMTSDLQAKIMNDFFKNRTILINYY